MKKKLLGLIALCLVGVNGMASAAVATTTLPAERPPASVSPAGAAAVEKKEALSSVVVLYANAGKTEQDAKTDRYLIEKLKGQLESRYELLPNQSYVERLRQQKEGLNPATMKDSELFGALKGEKADYLIFVEMQQEALTQRKTVEKTGQTALLRVFDLKKQKTLYDAVVVADKEKSNAAADAKVKEESEALWLKLNEALAGALPKSEMK